FTLFSKGGPLMWVIFLCSVVAGAIIVERLFHFQRAKLHLPNFNTRIKKLLLDNRVLEAEKFSENSAGPVAHIFAIGIHIHRRVLEQKERILACAGSREIRKLEKNLRTLGIIARISPLLGLLGTVTGMIKAFVKIQELGGSVDAAVLAGGIWEALLTTAAGLSVAIPAMVAYHYFEGKIDDFSAQMKEAVQTLSEWLAISSAVKNES
ncbi:MAG: MotA/TolQ/ExbB proton channel family protein, partial [Candidatus Omnitrophica bacterium]|nr:MotA/TolQ/ExbB proton channel family protein [Candidatus Omnitrophota bacterium]